MADLSQDLASLKINRDEGPGQRSAPRFLLWVLGAAAFAAGGYFGVERVKGEVFKAEIALTEVSLISPAQGSITVTSTGYVVPQIIAKLGAKVPGRLAKVHVKEGDVVKAGAVVAELEDADQRASIASAEARVTAARARVDAARANTAEIRVQVEREKKLVEQGARGHAGLEDLLARMRALEETARASAAEVGSAEAEAASLRVLLRDRTITSSIGGTVITKPPEVGEMVNGQTPLLEIADFASLMVETDVPEARLHLVKTGAPCEIVLDAYPQKRFRGKAHEIGKRANRAKATIAVKVKFTDAMDGVLPEMAARVSFLAEELSVAAMKEPPKHVVPASAVVERAGAKVVFAVDQGKVRMIPVSLGKPFGNGFELSDGPPPGTKLVDKPASDLTDGKKVKEKERD